MQQSAIHIGTSGYSYADWRGPFYPADLEKEEFLAWYARHFSFVELNYTYYVQPSPAGIEGMLKKTPDDFIFSIKAHKTLTHQIDQGNLEREIEHYRTGIAPLRESGRLAGILFQFPYSFHYTRDNRYHLAGLCERFADDPVFIEFRNTDWNRTSVRDAMASYGVCPVSTDTPDLRGLPANTINSSGNRLYLRFHGRNRENWWNGDNATRYDYLYSREELSEAAELIKQYLRDGAVLFTAFNNHLKGQAVVNARQLKALLVETPENSDKPEDGSD